MARPANVRSKCSISKTRALLLATSLACFAGVGTAQKRSEAGQQEPSAHDFWTEGFAIERRIRIAGVLIVLGLLLQMLTLLFTHPLAFMCFLMVGCPLVAAGTLLYLYSLMWHAESSARRQDATEP